ncbi:MAG: UDP-N-acetylmuramate dehydrogenase [Nitrospirota bacterium]|jgi:UDP-N-acetylmuramate dehydrogenase
MRAGKINNDFKEYLASGGLDAEVRFDEPMKAHTYLGIGGPADIFVVPGSAAALAGLLRAAWESTVQVLPLGGGTNLLVSDGGIEGAVVSVAVLSDVKILEEDGSSATLYAGSGYPLMRLLRFAAERGLKGMEGMAGIPGQVGGAVAGNAGAFGCEMKDVTLRVNVMDREGKAVTLGRDELGFAYRHAELPAGAVLLGAELRLEKDDPAEVSKRLEGFLREKKATQPLGRRSAGCVYKNPPGDFAGRLIEAAGCKGMRAGGIEVSPVHANFFVNTGEGTAADYMNLMVEVASRVKMHSGVVLVPEIRMVGRC